MATARYLWESFRGCSRCEALAGLYVGAPPQRPHPMCRCDIVRLQGDDVPFVPDQRVTDCYWVDLGHLRMGRDSEERPGNTFTLIFPYSVKCRNGEEHAGEVEVEQAWDDWLDVDADGNVLGRAYDAGFNVAVLEAFEKLGPELEALCECDSLL